MVQPFSDHEKKIEAYQIHIYNFSFNAAPIQGKIQYFTSQRCKPVTEIPDTTSNIYIVNVDLLNSVLSSLYLRLEISGHLSKTI